MPIKKLTPQNFELFSGNDLDIVVPVLDQNDKVVPITGLTIEWRLTRTNKNKTGLIEKTTVSGITITDGPGGIFTISILAADSEPLPGGDYYHEGRITDGLGKKSTVIYGFTLLRDNTVTS